MKEIGHTICFATSYNRIGKHDGDEFMREMDKFFINMNSTSDLFSRFWTTKPKGVTKRKKYADLRSQFENLFSDEFLSSYDNFVFFMHGTWRELMGIGHSIWTTHLLANIIRLYRARANMINIVLYACSCGRGKGKWNRTHEYDLDSNWDIRGEFGFAMRLAKDLSDLGVHNYRIYAHTGAGHTTRYPHCVWVTEDIQQKTILTKKDLLEPNGDIFSNSTTKQIIKRREIVPYRSWASPDRRGRRQWLRWVKFIQQTKTGRFQAPFLTEAELAEVIGE